MSVDGILLPVIDVDFLHAAQHQLELSLVKVVQPLERQNFVKPEKVAGEANVTR